MTKAISGWVSWIFALFVAGALIAGLLFRSEEAKAPATEPAPAAEPTQTTAPTGPVASIPLTTFTPVETFAIRAEAEAFINENQGKTSGDAGYERIVTGVVTDSQDASKVYFATSAYDTTTGTDFVGVYRFDLNTLSWWRLSKEIYKEKNGVAPALLRVIALDGTRLIVVEDRVNASHPAGTRIEDIGPTLSFDLDHPEQGFVPTDPPDLTL